MPIFLSAMLGGRAADCASGWVRGRLAGRWLRRLSRLGDARAERETAKAELAEQQPRLDRLNTAFTQKKEELTQALNEINRQIDASAKKLSALEAKGAKLKTAPCVDSRGASRVCVAVDGKAGGRVQVGGDWYVVAE